jgi:hypothetical protein
MNESYTHKVTVFPIDFNEPPIEYQITVPMTEISTIDDLRDMVVEDLVTQQANKKDNPKPLFAIAKDNVIQSLPERGFMPSRMSSNFEVIAF